MKLITITIGLITSLCCLSFSSYGSERCQNSQYIPPIIVNDATSLNKMLQGTADKDNLPLYCTPVYFGCGSCGENGALTEYYCDGGGSGHDPDYTTCDPC